MAERRMFTEKITESDTFLDMPLSTQALYFHYCMNADDDGFVKNPKRIQKMLGASEDDSKLLIVKRFVLPFDSGIIVIKHWRMHNLLRKDRYKPTEYIEEKSMLNIKENGAYTFDKNQGIPLMTTSWQPNDNQLATQDSIGKDSIDKISIEESSDDKRVISSAQKRKSFTPPTLEEVKSYCNERGNRIDAESFIAFYQSKGWKVGNQPMKDWKSAVITWEKRDKKDLEKDKPKMIRHDYNSTDFKYDNLDDVKV